MGGQSQGLGCIGLGPKMYMNYTEAYNFCNSKSMRLVEIYGENQNNFIKDLTANNPQDSYYGPTFGYWIDLVHITTKDGYLNGNGIIATMMLNSLLGMRKGIGLEMLVLMHIWKLAAIALLMEILQLL